MPKKKKKQLLPENKITFLNNHLKNKQMCIMSYNRINEAKVYHSYEKKFYYILRWFNLNKHLKIIFDKIKKNENQDIFIYPTTFIALMKDIDVKPFWNNSIQLLSDKIVLPQKHNLNIVQNKTFNSDTWFNTETYKCNDKNNFKIESIVCNKITEIIKTKKIKLYLNSNQLAYLRRFIGIYRYFYNRSISVINNYDKTTKTSYFYIDPTKKETKINIKLQNGYGDMNMIAMRKYLKTNYPEWMLPKFPSHTIDQAIEEAFKNFKICMERYSKTNKTFSLKYKNKKEKFQSFNIEKQSFSKNSNSIFSALKHDGINIFKDLKCSENFYDLNPLGSTLTYNKILNNVFLNITYKTVSKENQNKKCCSIDPGIRKFVTIYHDNGISHIGKDCCRKLEKVCKEIDIIQSRTDKKEYYTKTGEEKRVYEMNANRRRNLRKALHRKIEYVKNLKIELHNKTIKYLCDNFSTIILPPFETQKMVGKLQSKTARNMYNLSFYQFRRKLLEKSNENNITVLIKSECYTSKTCTKCGTLNYNLGSKEVFCCNNCKLIIDRDVNGARNIMLKNYNQIQNLMGVIPLTSA